MSKKIIIGLIVVVVIVAALPLIGNQAVKSQLDARVAGLSEQGIGVKSDDTQSSYLQTATHYEFQVEDQAKLQAFVNSMSSQQIPPYLTASLDGVTIGADIRYCNIPFISNVEVDIYPQAISSQMQTSLENSDADLSKQLTQFIQDKKLFYHLDYAIGSGSFSGYLKDIKEVVNFKDGTHIDFEISKARFNGEGTLIEPTQVISSIAKVSAKISAQQGEQFNFDLDNINSKSDFKSKNSYVSHIDFDTLNLTFSEKSATSELRAKSIVVDMESEDNGKKVSGKSDVTFDSFMIKAPELEANMKQFALHLSASGLDSEAFTHLQTVSEAAQANPTQQSQQEVLMASAALFSKGLTINVDKFSADQLQYNGSKMMKGFNHKVKVLVKPDPEFMQKLQGMPLALLQNFDVNAGLHFSKEFYSFINEFSPSTAMASSYAKEDGDDIVFDIVLENGALSVNGKSL